MNNFSLCEIEQNFEKKGSFYIRYGKAKNRGELKSNKKLCFIATDIKFLANLMFELSNYEKCYFVKYSHTSKDGMYLGRCFFIDEEAIGKMWYKYKKHPKLMCNIQDDDFTIKFRDQ